MRVVAAAVLGVCLAVATVRGQRAEFEVATVKLSPPVPLGRPIGINLGTFRNGTLTMTNVTLTECVLFAYSLVSQDQVIGPDWTKSRETRFDIVAKAAPGVDVEGARRMLRSLLADRLKLVARTEQRPYSFVAVVPAKGGAKLTPAIEGDGTPGSGGPGLIVGRQMPMSVLMSLLSRLEGQLFVDKTGLTGRYQIRLEWVPENDPTRSGASLSEALQEQLGLRMERKREPLDVIVVQAAERMPTDN
jgi:uncharacterized protein (TIGR03435 family)